MGASEIVFIAARDLRSAGGVDTIEVDGYGGSAAIGSARAGCGRGRFATDGFTLSHVDIDMLSSFLIQTISRATG